MWLRLRWNLTNGKFEHWEQKLPPAKGTAPKKPYQENQEDLEICETLMSTGDNVFKAYQQNQPET